MDGTVWNPYLTNYFWNRKIHIVSNVLDNIQKWILDKIISVGIYIDSDRMNFVILTP